jgi:archaellum component FlaF (FlaF/FlaG flagellin family)
MKNTTYDKRKGVSTILGTIIFIGIVFSTIVPMTLVMKQADNLYERTIHEVKMKDLEKANEELMVYAYSKPGNTDLTVYVNNRGENEVTVVRVWLNDDFEEVSQVIAPKTATELGPFDPDIDLALNVKVTTENGNIFFCHLGSIFYNSQNGWYTPSYAISVTIMNEYGQYKIFIWDNLDLKLVGTYVSSGNEADDISKTFLVAPYSNTYNVTVLKREGGDWITLLGRELGVFDVQVPDLVSGNPVAYVVVDGT